ncbi:PD-(D/E)XK motif protein [bacterium]|nr:MAG: PD-(D/E)XK motif protein [bacterium]
MTTWRTSMIPFELRWQTLEPVAFQRVDEEHSLDFYLGLDVSGERVLLLITQREETVQVQSQAIHVICRQRHDGRWALMFRLVRPELDRIFSHLCEDLVESSRQLPDMTNAARFILTRFARWQRLLQHGHTGLLDESAVRGLIGELLFLNQLALPAYGLLPAIEGWVGPLDAAQDFHYQDGLFEVKSIRSGTSKVMISSAEQLDDIGNALLLVVVMLDSAEQGNADAFCLPDIVSEVRKRLEGDSIALSMFEERLIAAGYIDREEYRRHCYKVGALREFTICEEFPRIMRSRLTSGIGKVIYELDLAACQPFEIKSKTEKSHGS